MKTPAATKTQITHQISNDKWKYQLQRERIEPAYIPHINSTMRTPYLGHELRHRGQERIQTA